MLKSGLAEFWRAMPITCWQLAKTTMMEPIRRPLQRPLVPPRPPDHLRQPSTIIRRRPLSPLLQPNCLDSFKNPGQSTASSREIIQAIDGEGNAVQSPPNPSSGRRVSFSGVRVGLSSLSLRLMGLAVLRHAYAVAARAPALPHQSPPQETIERTKRTNQLWFLDSCRYGLGQELSPIKTKSRSNGFHN
jgi:hypothetical protein